MAANDPYFRTSGETTDLLLLPAGQRGHDELAAVAASAEADVLAQYTGLVFRTGCITVDAGTVVERYVYLKGYSIDPTLSAASFAIAFRREIARVIRWRLDQWQKKPLLTSESTGQGATAKSYRADAEAMFPPDFGVGLRVFVIARDLAGLA